ncbi:hypothetical protein AOD81_0204280 [Helicobacter pylori]|nr:hypothetical protein AOD81_0204280 [Helicobacter pylori]
MLFQTLSIPLKNDFYIKIKLKTPFLKIKKRQVRLIQKIKKINFFNPIFKNKAFLPYSKFLKWDY